MGEEKADCLPETGLRDREPLARAPPVVGDAADGTGEELKKNGDVPVPDIPPAPAVPATPPAAGATALLCKMDGGLPATGAWIEVAKRSPAK